MFTREQLTDIQAMIKEQLSTIESNIQRTIKQQLTDDAFITVIVQKLEEKLKIKETLELTHKLAAKVEDLQKENQALKQDIEAIQQHMKRKSVRVHGVLESNKENLPAKMANLFKEKLNVPVKEEEMENCFRIGPHKNGKRTVLVSFRLTNDKRQIIEQRKRLKGSGITITEDLTPKKYMLLKTAAEKLGKEKVWFYGGEIRANINEQKHVIKSENDLKKLLGTHQINTPGVGNS